MPPFPAIMSLCSLAFARLADDREIMTGSVDGAEELLRMETLSYKCIDSSSYRQ